MFIRIDYKTQHVNKRINYFLINEMTVVMIYNIANSISW